MAQYGGISKYDDPIDEADMRDEANMSDEEPSDVVMLEGPTFKTIRSDGDIERLKRKLASYSNKNDDHYRRMEIELETQQKKLWLSNLNRARERADRRLQNVRHLCRSIETVNNVENADPVEFGDLMHELDEFLLAYQKWYDANTAHAT